jgi:chromodomain-helicase-DNA-binding protein 4
LKPFENFEFEDDEVKKTDEQILEEFKHDLVASSGKMILFDKLITQLLKRGHKVLVFSQFKLMLNILEDYLFYKDVMYLRLDGETPADLRQKQIDEFNKPDSEFSIFLLSTRAGGLGINLTRADTIIIFDSDFNPHNDLQALSRAHRIGQKNNVLIYRLVCTDSCEEKMVEIAKKKLKLAHLMNGKDNDDNLELNKILKFGTDQIFKSNEEKVVEYSQEFLDGLLDRKKLFEKEDEKQPENFKFDKPMHIEECEEDWETKIGKELEIIKEQEMLMMGKGMRMKSKAVMKDDASQESDNLIIEQDDDYEMSLAPQEVQADADIDAEAEGKILHYLLIYTLVTFTN